ncbi:hypothetical protein T484DRAFT_1872505 [Baffinella frigidus]|nr:hypothetical protein T484DRAFT_1872505 [Cryptophyta sp. CCMP2293]
MYSWFRNALGETPLDVAERWDRAVVVAAEAKHGYMEYAPMLEIKRGTDARRAHLSAASVEHSLGDTRLQTIMWGVTMLVARRAAAVAAAVTAAEAGLHLDEGGAATPAVVRLLLDSGVDISSRESDEATPLHHAAQSVGSKYLAGVSFLHEEGLM